MFTYNEIQFFIKYNLFHRLTAITCLFSIITTYLRVIRNRTNISLPILNISTIKDIFINLKLRYIKLIRSAAITCIPKASFCQFWTVFKYQFQAGYLLNFSSI